MLTEQQWLAVDDPTGPAYVTYGVLRLAIWWHGGTQAGYYWSTPDSPEKGPFDTMGACLNDAIG